jgi:hypothetical protein
MKHEFEMERASTSQTLVLTGIFASAGYVLLSSRAGLWVLAALTAGPLWKQFDPIVLVSGRKEEKERERAGGEPQEEEEETLQSLVR